ANIAREMMEANPEDFDAQRNLAVSFNRIGDALVAIGDLNGAREAFTEAMAMIGALLEEDPHAQLWMRDLSVSNERLGNVLKSQGDLDGALEQYHASLNRMMPLSEQNPEDQELARFV